MAISHTQPILHPYFVAIRSYGFMYSLILYYTFVLFYVYKVLYTRTEHGFNKQESRHLIHLPTDVPVQTNIINLYTVLCKLSTCTWVAFIEFPPKSIKGKLLIKSNSNLSFQVYLLHNCNAHKFFMYFQELVRELYQKQCKT